MSISSYHSNINSHIKPHSAGYNIIINNSYGPLLNSLPLTLAHKSYGMPKETHTESEEIHDPDSSTSERAPKPFARDPNAIEEHATTGNKRRSEDGVVGTRGFDKAKQLEANGDEEDDVQALRERPRSMPTDFNHPASVEVSTSFISLPTHFTDKHILQPQRPIWIPDDTLGLGRDEARRLREAGLDVATDDATMNEKGKVEIHGAPPEI